MTFRACIPCVALVSGLLLSMDRVDAHPRADATSHRTSQASTATVGERLRAAPTAAAQPAPGDPQEKFVPISELPPEEKLPAAPLLVAAYVVVSLLLFAYVYSLAKRFGGVKADIERLEAEIKRSTRT